VLTVKTPQVTRNFTMTKEFPAGMGYFTTAPQGKPQNNKQ